MGVTYVPSPTRSPCSYFNQMPVSLLSRIQLALVLIVACLGQTHLPGTWHQVAQQHTLHWAMLLPEATGHCKGPILLCHQPLCNTFMCMQAQNGCTAKGNGLQLEAKPEALPLPRPFAGC